MNALVTGGAGFIGSHLCEKLVTQNNFVICYDNLSTGNKGNLEALAGDKNFIFIEGDVMDVEKLRKVIRENGIDTVFHYAAVVGVKRTLENPVQVLNVNILGTKNVLDAAKDCKKVVFASSSEVYGEPVELPEREDGPTNAKLPYAVSKLVGENLCRAYFDEFGLKTTSLRLFNVFGPRQISSPYGFVIGIFVNRVLGGKPPVIFGDGTQTRDFMFIDDNIEVTLLAARTNKTDGVVLNIGTGRPSTISNLAEKIIEISGASLTAERAQAREHDIMHRLADTKRMQSLLSFSPKFSLEDGLKRTIEWYKNPKGK